MSGYSKAVKPVHVNSIDRGGAAIAALRLHRAYQKRGIDSTYVTGHKTSTHDDIIDLQQSMFSLEQDWFKRAYKKNLILKKRALDTGAIYWSDNRRWHSLPLRLNQIEADIFHLHWVGDGLIPISMMRWLDKPIVWTMHDNWGYTGGCHIHLDCTRHQQGCGQCPQLQSDNPDDMSAQVYQLKERAWRNLDLTVVTPSRWLGEQFRQSPIFKDKRVEVIPNGIEFDTIDYKDKSQARQDLSLDPDKSYLVFGAVNPDDPNKGGDLLIQAMSSLAQEALDLDILLIGNDERHLDFPVQFNVHRLGYIHDTSLLNAVYAAADVCVLPSRQENLSNMLMEATSNGTAVVAFDVGGNPDLIKHRHHGYLAKPYDTEDFAQGIKWAIEQSQVAGERAVAYARQHFDMSEIVRQYTNLYQHLLS